MSFCYPAVCWVCIVILFCVGRNLKGFVTLFITCNGTELLIWSSVDIILLWEYYISWNGNMIVKCELLMELHGPCKISRFHTGLWAVNFLKAVSPAPQSTVIKTLKSDPWRAVFTKCIKERCNWEVECVCWDILFTKFINGITLKICLHSRWKGFAEFRFFHDKPFLRSTKSNVSVFLVH